jgi:sigma-B regulation protein RsbU (phosphoserine phosphatase)
MFISVTKGLFQSLANKSNLEDIISQFNTSLISMKLQPMYLSLSLVRIQNDQLKFSGAGMPPALYYNYKKNSVEEIESSGPPLGGFPNFNYEINTYIPSKGDIIILMSDGFAERMNKTKEIYGWNKGKDLLAKMKHLSSNEIIKEFVKASDEWGEGREQDDDITFVILKVK